ncbi:histidine kinase [Erythrobacter sp.]|uniref:sensor histidine kinase n=1 Tax=Erythrobacter sp. TaxID=1042 RepID=UPI001B2B0A78|nr:histidine kinase [Erythrobacter sp.]MBO6525469.1 hypothetical protein [Erythrobacter sp.]MBO6529858.1 hypothetical protein [Erythrobacter sp.]
MQHDLPALASDVETIAELRELYRAAEARAARLRLLSTSGRELVEAKSGQLETALKECATRLALFLGSRSGRIVRQEAGNGFRISAPGKEHLVLGTVLVEGFDTLDDIADQEDRDACRMLLDMMGNAIDRVERETKMARLLAALREREHRLEHLVGRIFSAQEEERRRVAYELHDGVAQTATALVRMLEGAGDASANGIAQGQRGELTHIARGLVRELRAVISGLRPTILDDLGFVAALNALADGMEQDGYTVERRIDADASRLPAHVETALYRVAQEAISNIRKHAGGACRVSISASVASGIARPSLRIEDRGCGPKNCEDGSPMTEEGYHVGIEGMKERMSTIGGTLDWSVAETGGVIVEAKLPRGL